MDKNVIKNIIIEKQQEIPEYRIVKRGINLDCKANYVLVGLRRAGKSFMLYQDIQNMLSNSIRLG